MTRNLKSSGTTNVVKPKLLIATDSFLPRWDGISRFLSEIIPRLSKDFDITVLAPGFEGHYDKKRFANTNIITFPVSKMEVAGYNVPKPKFKKIQEHVRKSDIVWSQTIGPIGLLAMRYARKEEKANISYIHSLEWELFSKSITKRKKLRSFIEYVTKRIVLSAYNKSSLLLVPSEGIGQLLQRQGIYTNYKVVHMGVDTNVFKPKEKEELKSKFKLKGKLIGFSGRISKEKNLEILYSAFLKLKHRFKDLNLVFIGDGPMANKFPKAKITGFVNDVASYLNCLDIYILPSLTETSSISTMEAMSCERACVVSRVGYVKEYVKDGKNGIFFPKNNYKALAETISMLLDNPKFGKALGTNARKTIVGKYTWDMTSDSLIKIMKKM